MQTTWNALANHRFQGQDWSTQQQIVDASVYVCIVNNCVRARVCVRVCCMCVRVCVCVCRRRGGAEGGGRSIRSLL